MTPFRAFKIRLHAFLEAHSWLRPLSVAIKSLLVFRFKAKLSLHRKYLGLQLITKSLLSGKKLVVVYRDVGIGDLVCTFPLVLELRKQFDQALVVYVTHLSFAPFVQKFSGAHCAVGTSYVLYANPLPSLPSWLTVKTAQPLYFDEVPNLPKRERLGFVREMAESCDTPLSHVQPLLRVEKSEVDLLLGRLKIKSSQPNIGIHAGPTVPVKEWTFESWRQLIQLTRQEMTATFFQFGSSWHSSHPGEIKEELPVQFNLTGQLNLIETTLLISQMDLFIGIDSGLLHIANALGVPCIGLFGPTDPSIVMSGPSKTGLFVGELPCIFCQHRKLNLHWQTGCPYDIQCMRQLLPETVLAEVKVQLKMA